MTRHSLDHFVLAAAALFAAQIPARSADLIKSDILESNVLYLRVGEVGKNLPEEIQSAQSALSATNQAIGTVLDLRFTDGDDLDSAKTTADWFAQKKLPLAILVDGETRGAAVKLAEDLRDGRAGLIFGNSAEVKPDIAVAVKNEDERKFLENPYRTPVDGTNSAAVTNNLLPFVDHLSEADLVRAKVKDGDGPQPVPQPAPSEPQPPVIRDPVLARALDLIKGLAIVRASHS